MSSSSQPITHTFKTVAGLDIGADIYVPSSATQSSPCTTVLVWWHGGGLLQGTRKAMPPHMKRAIEGHNIVVVSADYRLAPQTRMPGILADARDVVAFTQSQLGDVTGGRARPDKLFVSGSSAGGWLALLVANAIGFEACGVPPLPSKVTGCIPIYPITDISDPFWTTKQHPVSYMKGRIVDGPKELGDDCLDPKAPPTASSAPDSKRSQFYHYMIQEALLQQLLLEGTSVKPKDVAVAPALAARKAKDSPPTIIIHGT